ncbi:ESX secretion-associated protein EspG [Amycolatopsis sp. NPDC059021]|uniref:ESX secretion-associated protein EspG n=1 Tax=Amycolatopsis sp. NPDC059021 TaxID=3346704 RepID=UPI00366E0935
MARTLPSVNGIVLSHLEYDLLWADLGLGPQPYPLEVRSHGYTMDERDVLGGQVFDGLAEAGLIDEDDRVDPRVDELLESLARPVVSVDALVVGEISLRVLAAAGKRRGVLATLDDVELALRPMWPDELVDVVAGVIGDCNPGPGEPVRLPRETFSEAMRAFADKGYPAFERTLARAGITGRATRALSTMVDSPRHVSGQLAANGAAGRSPVVSWFDTDAGRYGATVQDVAGTRWVTVTPANGHWLVNRVEELLHRAGETGTAGGSGASEGYESSTWSVFEKGER